MANRVQISSIRKNDRQSAYERISSIGGTNPDGKVWSLTLDEAIAGIEGGKWDFYTKVGNHAVDVVVAKAASGRKYLRTTADRDTPDNLLSLPECR